LSDEAHYILKDECEKLGVEFLTTCYDENRIPFLKKIGLKKIKIASTDLKHFNFLKKIRENFDEVIVSTGMSNKEEILKALEILKNGKYTIMHCVSVYPCPLEKANLKKLIWLKGVVNSVGYSDHVQGLDASIFSLGIGVDYIEKHFTLDRNMKQQSHTTGKGLKPITTHTIADEPKVFENLCKWRDKFEIALGSGNLDLLPEEKLTREKYTGRLGKNY
jgi:sialic acid synthase SpsE